MIDTLLMVVMFVTAVFLILLVLIQRGKGGGLAGALGGMGGQSAFGTKAGDLFTRITIGVAAFWIIVCSFAVTRFSQSSDLFQGAPESEAPAGDGLEPLAPDASDSDSAAPAGDAESSKPASTPVQPEREE